LSLGLERLKEGSANGVLTVTVSAAFAAKWLLPRIDRFQASWPDTDVRLDTSAFRFGSIAASLMQPRHASS
jgi:LysR family glycine cleavage system transcriptional activator